MNWAQMSKQNLNLWLKSRNKEILSTILLNRISHLALERVYMIFLMKLHQLLFKNYLPKHARFIDIIRVQPRTIIFTSILHD